MLVNNLPPDSATVRARDGEWTTERELAASTVEGLDHVWRALVVLNHQWAGEKSPDFGPPIRYPHPDRPQIPEPDPEPVKIATAAELVAFIERVNA